MIFRIKNSYFQQNVFFVACANFEPVFSQNDKTHFLIFLCFILVHTHFSMWLNVYDGQSQDYYSHLTLKSIHTEFSMWLNVCDGQSHEYYSHLTLVWVLPRQRAWNNFVFVSVVCFHPVSPDWRWRQMCSDTWHSALACLHFAKMEFK